MAEGIALALQRRDHLVRSLDDLIHSIQRRRNRLLLRERRQQDAERRDVRRVNVRLRRTALAAVERSLLPFE